MILSFGLREWLDNMRLFFISLEKETSSILETTVTLFSLTWPAFTDRYPDGRYVKGVYCED